MKEKLLKIELKNAYWFPPGAKIAIIPEGKTKLEVFEVAKRKKNTLWVKEWDYPDDKKIQKAQTGIRSQSREGINHADPRVLCAPEHD